MAIKHSTNVDFCSRIWAKI